MGNRILIWRQITKNNELDIFSSTDYSKISGIINEKFGGSCPNWGNKLWFQGLVSEIDDGNNELVFRSNETIDEINNNFDLVIYPMANFFNKEYVIGSEKLSETISKIKIPVYVISCGAQADNYDCLEDLVKEIGEPSKKFISAIYSTGGEFSLRGHFTKEFFSRLGFDSAVVTGCPSLYQLGRDFKVDNSKVDASQFNPVFNGKYKYFIEAIMSYKSSAYIDQDLFGRCLFDNTFLNDTSLNFMINYCRQLGIESTEMLAENKVKLIADMNDWYSYIKNSNFNYSFGSRIHGSIMALLAGVPATVLAIDTRTQEMAEFFDIPCEKISVKNKYRASDVYEMYLKADYGKFNETFSQKFDNYEKFLKDHKIVEKINENNKFFDSSKGKLDFEKYVVNTEKFAVLRNQMRNKRIFISIGSTLKNLKEKI